MKILMFFLVLSFFSGAVYADVIKRKVTNVSGEKLVQLALKSTPYQNSGFEDPPDDSDETFLIYPILGASNGFLAHLAVNPWTGDVWNMDECTRITNSGLIKAQADIKKEFNSKELKEYKRLRDLKPYRMYDLEPCS